MRALILVLITLNLALAAWSWHYDKLSSHDEILLASEIPGPSIEPDEVEYSEESSEGVDAPPMASPDSTEEVDAVEEVPVVAATSAVEPEVQQQSKPKPVEAVAVSQSASKPKPSEAPPVDEPAKELAASVPAAIPQPVPNEPPVNEQLESSTAKIEAPITAAISGCIVYGPFERPVEAAQLVQRLQLDGYAGEFDQKNTRVHRGRWVLFPVADTSEAEKLIASMNGAGLSDFGLVRKSPFGMAVSAGLYAGERSLNARLDALMGAGFTPKVDNLYRDASFYQVTVEEAPENPEDYGKFLACNA